MSSSEAVIKKLDRLLEEATFPGIAQALKEQAGIEVHHTYLNKVFLGHCKPNVDLGVAILKLKKVKKTRKGKRKRNVDTDQVSK